MHKSIKSKLILTSSVQVIPLAHPPITVSYYVTVKVEEKHLLLPVGVFGHSVMQTAVILHHTVM